MFRTNSFFNFNKCTFVVTQKKLNHRLARNFASYSTGPLSKLLEPVIEAPKLSNWEYKQIKLDNGILVTIVHDGESEKSSCCLGVAVGAKDDPEDYPGLAHFTEHAVFMGSEKYPNENEYKTHINTNGGGTNGGTGMETTVYQFTINSQAFDKALDIYSQFFKAPLFQQTSLTREIIAVDSEDSKNRILEGRRNLQLLKSLMSSKSHYEKFSTGNLFTLAKTHDVATLKETSNGSNNNDNSNMLKLTQAMKAFHTKYYLPQNMVLALVGPQSLKTLESYAQMYFADIISAADKTSSSGVSDAHINIDSATARNISLIPFAQSSSSTATTSSDRQSTIADTYSVYPFQAVLSDTDNTHTIIGGNDGSISSSNHGKIIRSRPVQETKELSLLFSFPYTIRPYYRANPFIMLTYLLSNKNKQSLYDVLLTKEYILSLSAGTRESFIDFTLFEINIRLTDKGLQEYEEVVRLIYAYIGFIEQALVEAVSESSSSSNVHTESSSNSENSRINEEVQGDDNNNNHNDNDNNNHIAQLWKELYTINQIDFQYQERMSGYDLVQELVNNMIRYPSQHVFSAGWLIDEQIDQSFLRHIVKCFIPQRSILFLKSSTFDWIPKDISTLNINDPFIQANKIKTTTSTDATDNCDGESLSSSAHVKEIYDYMKVPFTTTAATSTSATTAPPQPVPLVNRLELYYGVPYRIDDIDPSTTLQHWHSARHSSSSSSSSDAAVVAVQKQQHEHALFRLPPLNPYISPELLVMKSNNTISSAAVAAVGTKVSSSTFSLNSNVTDTSYSPTSVVTNDDDDTVVLNHDAIVSSLQGDMSSHIHSSSGSSGTANMKNATKGDEVCDNDGDAVSITNVSLDTTLLSPLQQPMVVHSAYPQLLLPSTPLSSSSSSSSAATISTHQLWHSRDELFHLPRSSIVLFITTPLCGDGHPINNMISTLYSQLTSYKYYPAAIAGLEYRTSVNNRGFTLTVSGYSLKLAQFMKNLCADWLFDNNKVTTEETSTASSSSSPYFWKQGVISPTLFDNFKNRSLQNIQSWYTSRPDQQADSILSYLLTEDSKLPADMFALTRSMTLTDVYERVQYIQNSTRVIMYTHGDMSENESRQLYTDLESQYFNRDRNSYDSNCQNSNSRSHSSGFNIVEFERIKQQQQSYTAATTAATTRTAGSHFHNINLVSTLPPPAVKSLTNNNNNNNNYNNNTVDDANTDTIYEVQNRARVLRKGSDSDSSTGSHTRVILPAFNKEDPNSALITYFETEKRSPRLSALHLIISRLLSEPLFTALRTQQQLGYIVSFSSTNYGRYPAIQRGFTVRVLSKQYCPVYMENKLQEFLESYRLALDQHLTEEKVTILGQNIIQSLVEPPKSYTEEANNYYDAIVYNKPFNMTEVVIEELQHVSAQEVKDFCNQYLFQRQTRKTLSIMLFGGVSSCDIDNNNDDNGNNNNDVSSSSNSMSERSYGAIVSRRKPSPSVAHTRSTFSYAEILNNTCDTSSSSSEVTSISSSPPAYFPQEENSSSSGSSDSSMNNDSSLYVGLDEVKKLKHSLKFLE